MIGRIGIVVSAGSKMIRRIVVPDRDDGELDHGHVGHGERMIKVIRPSNLRMATIAALVRKHTGTVPPDSRCAVVRLDKPLDMSNADTGEVVAVIHADPEIDAIDGCVLVSHPAVAIGWRWHSETGLSAPD
jgi:hypothetical protein